MKTRAKGFLYLLALAVSVGFMPVARAADALDACPVGEANQPERWEGEHAWEALAAQGYRIGKIKIVVDNVFDLHDPVEDTWYARTADVLHISTLPGVIRDELLIAPDQAVDARVVYESERRLRALSFLRYAMITPITCRDGVVDVEAHVEDAWTLKFNLSFAHVGGQSTFNASFEDVDFLGTGKTLAVGHDTDTQRTSNRVTYVDPALFGSRWQLGATYAHLSDGSQRSLNLGQPFYEDETPWSLNLQYLDQEQDLNFYDHAKLAWRAEDIQHFDELDWMQLLHWGDRTGTRAGVSYLYEDFSYGPLQTFPATSLPEPSLVARRFAGPALTWEYFQDRYASFTDLALIGRAEDYDLGWDTHAQLGYFGKDFGSRTSAWFYSLSSSYGLDVHGDTLMLASGGISGRRQGGLDHDVQGNLAFTLYNQSFGAQTLVLHGTADFSIRPDSEYALYLGGLQGMPGYPNYYLIGDRRWQMTAADRVLTQTRLLNTFQVGFSAYADMGQVRQFETNDWSRTLADAGIALRLGDIRSAYGGVIYVTFAWPLVKLPGADKRQFVIGNIVTF